MALRAAADVVALLAFVEDEREVALRAVEVLGTTFLVSDVEEGIVLVKTFI